MQTIKNDEWDNDKSVFPLFPKNEDRDLYSVFNPGDFRWFNW